MPSWHFLLGTRDKAQAIIEAMISFKSGIEVNSKLWCHWLDFRELEIQVEVIHQTKKVFAAKGEKVKYLVGTMIEIPRRP